MLLPSIPETTEKNGCPQYATVKYNRRHQKRMPEPFSLTIPSGREKKNSTPNALVIIITTAAFFLLSLHHTLDPLHVSQLLINLPVQKHLLLARQLGLQSLLY